jgi:hypothetical protein
MSVREKGKLLNIPMPGSARPQKKEPESPQLLDVSMMKARPKKNGSGTLRSAHSAPDVREEEKKAVVVASSSSSSRPESPTAASDGPAPGKISIGELRQLALQEKERAEREKAEQELRAKKAEEKFVKETSPRSKIDDLLALNAQLNRGGGGGSGASSPGGAGAGAGAGSGSSPPKAAATEEKKKVRKRATKKGRRKTGGLSKSSSSLGPEGHSDQEEESSSGEHIANSSPTAAPAEASTEKKVRAFCFSWLFVVV